MRRALLWIWVLILLPLSVGLQGEERAVALVLDVKGAVGPATADYVRRGLDEAVARSAPLLILRMDTPGGLDSAMRDIIRDILASPIPVATYVAPGGARAASAGTYILYASHIAAMAPATNLGAATPVQIGGVPDPGKSRQPPQTDKAGKPMEESGNGDQDDDAMGRKMVNDAVAYIRGLAHMRGRNAEWAEEAVRSAASLPAEQALEKKVIDVMAGNLTELLATIDGREVQVLGESVTLATAGLDTETLEPDWRNRLLAVITDPNVAYILMLIGMYGLFFEFANPGYVLPGVVGAICLLLALYAFQVLPVNYAGLALVLLGIAFMVAEAFAPSFGALGLGGVAAFVIGSIILFRDDAGDFAVALPLVGGLALLSAGFFIGVLGMVLKLRAKPVVSGREEMIAAVGEVLEDFTGRGRIRVHGEMWWAESDTPLRQHQRVQVTAMDGLVLRVVPLTEE